MMGPFRKYPQNQWSTADCEVISYLPTAHKNDGQCIVKFSSIFHFIIKFDTQSDVQKRHTPVLGMMGPFRKYPQNQWATADCEVISYLPKAHKNDGQCIVKFSSIFHFIIKSLFAVRRSKATYHRTGHDGAFQKISSETMGDGRL